MKLAELRQKLLPRVELPVADGVLAALAAEGKIRRVADRYALGNFQIKLTKRQNNIRERLRKIYRDAGIEVPGTDEVLPMFESKEKEDVRQVLESMVSSGELVLLTPQIILHADAYKRMYETAREWFAENETLTLAQYRDLLNTSRKYALAALEYFDKNKMTKKDGDFSRATSNF